MPALATGAAAAFLAFLAFLASLAAGLRLAGAFFFGAALPPPQQALVNAASSQASMPFLAAAAPLVPAPGPATRRSARHGEGGARGDGQGQGGRISDVSSFWGGHPF